MFLWYPCFRDMCVVGITILMRLWYPCCCDTCVLEITLCWCDTTVVVILMMLWYPWCCDTPVAMISWLLWYPWCCDSCDGVISHVIKDPWSPGAEASLGTRPESKHTAILLHKWLVVCSRKGKTSTEEAELWRNLGAGYYCLGVLWKLRQKQDSWGPEKA